MKGLPLLALVLGFSITAIIGCGGDDEAPADPRQQCEYFLDVWCNKTSACALPTDHARALEDCRFVVELDVNCAIVKQVSGTYRTCIDDILASKCVSTDGIDLPGMCNKVLLR